MSDPWTRDVEPGSVCGGCGRRVPIPKEEHTHDNESEKKAQLSMTFRNASEKEAYLALEEQARQRLIDWHVADPDNVPAVNVKTPRSLVLVHSLVDWLTS